EEVRDTAHELERAVKLAQIAEESEERTQCEAIPVWQEPPARRGALYDFISADVPDNQVSDAHNKEKHREERDPHLLGVDLGVSEALTGFKTRSVSGWVRYAGTSEKPSPTSIMTQIIRI